MRERKDSLCRVESIDEKFELDGVEMGDELVGHLWITDDGFVCRG